MIQKDTNNNSETLGRRIKELETEIVRLRKETELKTGWISLLSHDFKEAFLSLNMLLEAFDANSLSEDDFFSLLPQIKQDCQKNLNVINDTAIWIKTQSDGFKPQADKFNGVELYLLLKDEFGDLLERKKISFSFKGDEALKITTDRILISFVLRKMLDNAIKFSHPNAKIYFEITATDNGVTLSIEDHGIGMDQKYLNTLFSFDSALFKGTQGEIGSGLSLKIARNFVFLLLGNMHVESSEGKGTRISINLPIEA